MTDRGEMARVGGSGPGSGADLETPKTQLYQHGNHFFAFSLHFFLHLFCISQTGGHFFWLFFCISQTGSHFFAFPRPGLPPSPLAWSGWENDKKMTKQWQKKWPACWWNCVFGLSSSAPDPATRAGWENDKKMTNKWNKNDNKMVLKNTKKWQPNGKKITKEWHRKTGMTKKWQNQTTKKYKKMTKINIQQPSEFAGKIFIILEVFGWYHFSILWVDSFPNTCCCWIVQINATQVGWVWKVPFAMHKTLSWLTNKATPQLHPWLAKSWSLWSVIHVKSFKLPQASSDHQVSWTQRFCLLVYLHICC